MSDPIQSSELARRNAEERRITLGAISDPVNTKMADGRTVAAFQQETYEAHLAEARAAEAIQIQRTRAQSIANDPIYQGEKVPESVAPTASPKREIRARPVDRPGDEQV